MSTTPTGPPPPEQPPAQPPASQPGDAAPPVAARDQSDLSTAERWRRSSTAGALAGALAMGMAKVFDPARVDTITIEQPAPAPPEEPEGIELRFDPESAHDTVAIVRPDQTVPDVDPAT